MKENSKVKLERQLNENPELKERFNLQMKSITESVKETTAPFEGLADSVKALENLSLPLENIMNSFKAIKPTTATQSIVESLELINTELISFKDIFIGGENEGISELYDERISMYISLRESESDFIKHKGIYVPKNVYEFLDWYFECYLFGTSISEMKEVKLNLYHFRHFNEYKERLLEYDNWDLSKEYEHFYNKDNATDTPDSDDNEFSAIQWGAIFYYADTTKLLTGKNITDKLEAFHKKHNINITVKYFRQKYYKAVDQLNKYNNYPIKKLEAIIPFLEQHYKHTVTKVKNDIDYLQDYKDENE